MKQKGAEQPTIEDWARAKMPFRKYVSVNIQQISK